jgi:ABC-2 type transport system permease protein
MSSNAMTAVLRSEWIKAATVRSTPWTLALTVATSIAVGVLDSVSVKGAIARHSTMVRPDFNAPDAGFVGIGYGQLCLVVFAVLITSTEYTSGMIRSSLTAVPGRALFYAGKLAVVAAVAFAVALATAFVSFIASEKALGGIGVSLSTPHLAGALLGAAGFLALLCVFSAAVAFVLRSSAMALGVLIPFYFVVPTILALAPGLRAAADYLPDQAGSQMMQPVTQGSSPLTAGSGCAVLAAWTVFAVLCGYLGLRLRDA